VAPRDGFEPSTNRLTAGAYCLVVDGDGLRPKFARGDIIVVDPDRIPKAGDMVVL
jgi:phage repressor protein C with HTH and peptisase S24 domain